MYPTKRCSTCEEVKPLKEFYRMSRSVDGLHYRCKGCCRVLNGKSRLKGKASQGSKKEKYKRRDKSTRLWTKRHTYRDPTGDPTISLHELYHRDQGICGICGEEVLPSDASMDHTVSIALGGKHIWDNVQLAHLTCNKRKGRGKDAGISKPTPRGPNDN